MPVNGGKSLFQALERRVLLDWYEDGGSSGRVFARVHLRDTFESEPTYGVERCALNGGVKENCEV